MMIDLHVTQKGKVGIEGYTRVYRVRQSSQCDLVYTHYRYILHECDFTKFDCNDWIAAFAACVIFCKAVQIKMIYFFIFCFFICAISATQAVYGISFVVILNYHFSFSTIRSICFLYSNY